MGFTDAFTGFFKKEKAKPQMQVTTVDTAAELGKGAAYNVGQTTEHQARAQGIDAKEKDRFDTLYGSANLDREKRNQEIADQFVNQGFSNAANSGLQSAMRQFTGAAAQSTAGTGLWGRGAGMPISLASDRTAGMITQGQQYGLGLSQNQMGVQQNRAFSFQNAANNLWQQNMVRPETFLAQANTNVVRQDDTANTNKMIDWANAGRKSLFEQGIQRSMGSILDMATNPQTQISAVSSLCNGGQMQQNYPGSQSMSSPGFAPVSSFGNSYAPGGYTSSMQMGNNPFSQQGFSNGFGTGSTPIGQGFSSGSGSTNLWSGGGAGGAPSMGSGAGADFGAPISLSL